MNNITVFGRIGRDPEMRTTANGTSVLNFPIADSKKVQGNEITTWFDCSLFGTRAEKLAPYIRKGEQISVSGSIELQKWTGQDGTEKSKIVLTVSDVGLVSGQSQSQQPAQQQPQGFAQQPQQGFAPPPAQGFQQPQGFGSHAPQQLPQGHPDRQAQAQQGRSLDDFSDDIPF